MAIIDLEPRLLVEAHNAGDDEAFRLIVLAHHQSLFAHAFTRLHEVQAAEDAVQETFVRAYRAMPRFQGDFHLRAWLHRILTNVCHDEGARRQREARLHELAAGQAVVEAESADLAVERMDVDREAVVKALASLPRSYREALLLRYVDELSYEQVAAATGVTEGNARVRVMRGRAALRRAITSSHAVVIAVVPWLRRGGREPIVDLPSLGASASASASSVGVSAVSVASSPSVLSNAPLFLRALDTAPQVAERAASIPQVIGMIAAMAVPIAVPVVGDRVVGWGDRPPAAVAPAATELAAGTGGTGVTGGVPTSAPSGTTTTVATASDPSAGAAAAALETATTVTTTAPSTTTSAPAATATSTPPTTAAPPTTTEAPAEEAPVAEPVAFESAMKGSQLSAVGDPRTDLAGTIDWGNGPDNATAELRGTLVFDRPATTQQPQSDDSGDPPATDAAAEAEPRRFTGELKLSLEDGRTYVLRLSEGTLDAPGTGTAASAAFELLDRCGSVLASGTLTGVMDLQQAPVPASLDLVLDGTSPAEVPACG